LSVPLHLGASWQASGAGAHCVPLAIVPSPGQVVVASVQTTS
jgi:hypothetical protein